MQYEDVIKINNGVDVKTFAVAVAIALVAVAIYNVFMLIMENIRKNMVTEIIRDIDEIHNSLVNEKADQEIDDREETNKEVERELYEEDERNSQYYTGI